MNKERGVTMIELLIVMTLIALVVGLTYPSISSGVGSLRLRSAGDGIANFLSAALDRAERRQQAVEISILPKDNALVARSSDNVYQQRLDIAEPVRIIAVRPLLVGETLDDPQPRRFLVYPGGTVPRIGVEIAMSDGRKRMVSIDPMTASPRSEVVP